MSHRFLMLPSNVSCGAAPGFERRSEPHNFDELALSINTHQVRTVVAHCPVKINVARALKTSGGCCPNPPNCICQSPVDECAESNCIHAPNGHSKLSFQGTHPTLVSPHAPCRCANHVGFRACMIGDFSMLTGCAGVLLAGVAPA